MNDRWTERLSDYLDDALPQTRDHVERQVESGLHQLRRRPAVEDVEAADDGAEHGEGALRVPEERIGRRHARGQHEGSHSRILRGMALQDMGQGGR